MKNKKINANTISGLETKLAELQGISNATRNELSAKIKQLEENKKAAVAAKQEANALVKQLQNGQQQLSEELQGKIAKLQGELSGSTSVTKTLTNKISNLTSKKETALAKLNEAEKKLAKLNSKLRAKNQNLNSIKSQLAARENEIKTLTNVSEKSRANLLAQVQAARKLSDNMIREKAEAEERARKYAALMKKFSNELMPKISGATLERINTLNTSEYKNIEPEVKAAINKRKVELYKNELAKRNTNLANLRSKLEQIPPGTEGKKTLSTEINTEEARRIRVAKALNFRKMIKTNLNRENLLNKIKNQIKKLENKLPENDDTLLEKLPSYMSEYREIFGKPKKFIFFNKVPENGKGIFTKDQMTIPEITTFQLGAMGNNFTKQLQKNFKEVDDSFGTNSTNVFFVGPSGSGKTTLFKQYTDSNNLTKLSGITVYKPTLKYFVNQGILYFSDEVKENYNYSQFASEFIRPTPFNPQSSRAHMSIEKVKNRRVFDLAGKESPVAISELALGLNVFNGKYWNLDQSFEQLMESQKSDRLKYLLKIIGLKVKGLTDLDKIIVVFIYKNFFYNSYAKKLLTTGNYGIKLFTNILRDNQEAKLSDYFGEYTNNSKIIDINFIKNYDSYKAKIVKEFGLSNPIPEDLQGGTTVVRYIFEMMKRVFEGVYITRSLFSLRPLFQGIPEDVVNNLIIFKNITSKNTSYRIPGINDNNGFGMKVKKCDPKKMSDCLFKANGINKEPLYTNTQKKVAGNAAKNNFVVLPNKANNFKYKTSFYEQIRKKKDFKNCLIGVISDFETLESKVTQQRQSLEFFKKI